MRVVTDLADTVVIDTAGTAASQYRLSVVDGFGTVRAVGLAFGDGASRDTTATAGLALAYPLPCRASGCTIALGLATPIADDATVRVFDVHGSLVRTLALAAGATRPAVMWDVRDDAGRRVATGVYEARIEAGASRHRVRILVLR